jgi:flavin reductase (DIM6/NTAB) family NADH-FMN oxidoreductase RutF
MRPIVNSENTRFPDESAADTAERPVTREDFLAAMRQVAATVTVVTTDGPAGRAGATVSAFTSLSADPPSVLVCLRSDSQIAQAVHENGVFCVNVLPEDADEMARAFTGKPNDSAESRFDGIALRETAFGPLLPGATAFTCRLAHRDTYGSHAICVGDVESLINTGATPLAYMSGAFHVVRPKRS